MEEGESGSDWPPSDGAVSGTAISSAENTQRFIHLFPTRSVMVPLSSPTTLATRKHDYLHSDHKVNAQCFGGLEHVAFSGHCQPTTRKLSIMIIMIIILL